MDINSRKIAFIEEFLKLQNETAISKLEKHLRKEVIAENLKFKPMTIKEYESRLRISLEDSRNGRVISAEDLLEEIKTWK